MRKILALITMVMSLGLLAACGDERQTSEVEKADKAIQRESVKRKPYIPRNAVEFKNYNAAQKLYDDPTTVIWCTAFPSSATAPIVTTPIAGKLTSSSVSYLPPDKVIGSSNGNVVVQNKSNSGMYHGSPPPYRYGFTPGGQYIDFSGMEVLCTTQLTKFQKTKTIIDVTDDSGSKGADSDAEKALKRGDKAAAQRAVERVANGG